MNGALEPGSSGQEIQGLVVLVLSAAVLLGGCAEKSPSSGCHAYPIQGCPAAGEPLIGSGFAIQCEHPNDVGVGFLVNRSVVLENFVVRDCGEALRIEGPGCPTCFLTIRNGTVVASGMLTNVNAGAAIEVLGEWKEIRIQNVTVDVTGAGSAIDLGLHGYGTPTKVELDRLRLRADRIADHTAGIHFADLVAQDEVSIANSTVAGFSRGLEVAAGQARVRAFHADNNRIGLVTIAEGLNLEQIFAENNTATGVIAWVAPFLVGHLSTGLQAKHLVMRHNGLGLNGTHASQIDATDWTVEGNAVGVVVGPATLGSVSASKFSGNALAFDSGENPFDASGNWWGSPNGPTLDLGSAKTPGAGDAVSPLVKFIPFRDQP